MKPRSKNSTTTKKIETPEEREKRIRRRLRDDFEYYARKCLKVIIKDENDSETGEAIVPFVLNRAQRYIYARCQDQLERIGKVRRIGCKGRQQGYSTLVEGLAMWLSSHRRGFNVFILTHHDKSTTNLFRMAKRYYDNLPALVKPVQRSNNANELSFAKLDSKYAVATAGGQGAGRSEMIKFFHWSEVAFCANAKENARGALQTLSKAAGTWAFMESTSDGPGNYFHQQCLDAIAGKSQWEFDFIPWFWQEEYSEPLPDGFEPTLEELELLGVYGGEQADGGPGLTMGHLVWRRWKVTELGGEEAFQREYPNSAEEAFAASAGDKLISALDVQAAKSRDVVANHVRPLWGLDPARKGRDSSALCKRTGNVKHKGHRWQIADTMALVGRIVAEYRATPYEERPSHIIVDSIGIGGPVADRLREKFEEEYHDSEKWSDRTAVIDVNVSESAGEGERFNKLRDELAWRAKEWFETKAVKIDPADERFIIEAGAIEFGYTSGGKVKIADKEKTKKQLAGNSPDDWDAFVNTFYVSPQPRDAVKVDGSHMMRTAQAGGAFGGSGGWMSRM